MTALPVPAWVNDVGEWDENAADVPGRVLSRTERIGATLVHVSLFQYMDGETEPMLTCQVDAENTEGLGPDPGAQLRRIAAWLLNAADAIEDAQATTP